MIWTNNTPSEESDAFIFVDEFIDEIGSVDDLSQLFEKGFIFVGEDACIEPN